MALDALTSSYSVNYDFIERIKCTDTFENAPVNFIYAKKNTKWKNSFKKIDWEDIHPEIMKKAHNSSTSLLD